MRSAGETNLRSQREEYPYRDDREVARELVNQECGIQKPREVCVNREGAVNWIRGGQHLLSLATWRSLRDPEEKFRWNSGEEESSASSPAQPYRESGESRGLLQDCGCTWRQTRRPWVRLGGDMDPLPLGPGHWGRQATIFGTLPTWMSKIVPHLKPHYGNDTQSRY